MQHRLNAYIDNHKKIVYCEVCALEDPDLSATPECAGKYVPPVVKAQNGTDDNQGNLFHCG